MMTLRPRVALALAVAQGGTTEATRIKFEVRSFYK